MRRRKEKWQAEEGDWLKRMKTIEERMEQIEKKEKKNNVTYNNRNRGNRSKYTGDGRMFRKGDGGEVNVKEAFKINKDTLMLAKIETWEQKKTIMLNKSKLKDRKGERMYIDDDLANEERKTQKS
ncbi:unnamed protein product [Tenebrio molitor]|nr:unnamed protein product [Tenebrio molitor]